MRYDHKGRCRVYRTAWLRSSGLACCLLAALGIPSTAIAQGEADGQTGAKPRVDVTLHASVERIVPGSAFDLAVAFDIEDDWYIYWTNPGDAGMPPSIQWTGPAGFTISELLHPFPRRKVEAGALTTFIHEGKPILIARVTPPEHLSVELVTLTGDLRYLVCKTRCILGQAQLHITLPVARQGESAGEAHKEVFQSANRRLPGRESRHLALKPALSKLNPVEGDELSLNLEVRIQPGIHIQSSTPAQPAFFRCDVFMEPVPGVAFQEPEYPPAKQRNDPILGPQSEYAGNVTIRIPLAVTESLPSTPYTLRGVFAYQACNDRGNCFPPNHLAFAVRTDGTAVAGDEPRAAFEPNYTVSETADASGDTKALATAIEDDGGGGAPLSLLLVFGLAFVGGLILNVMPCVLPVISIKVLSFVEQAGETKSRYFRLNMMFVSGIITCFVALAVMVVVLRSAFGENIGWGYQFSRPEFVLAMIVIVFVFAMSLLGVFLITLPGKATTGLAAAEMREGYPGAFLKGVLGTILATPCTAPFLGTALTAAFTSSNTLLILLFATMGLGMASPFVLLAFNPNWLRLLPRPGLWMERFKQIMGFLLLGTVVWLLIVLNNLIGGSGLVWTVAFLTFLGFALWLIGTLTPASSTFKRLNTWGAAMGVAALGWWLCFHHMFRIEEGSRLVAEISRNAALLAMPPECPAEPAANGRSKPRPPTNHEDRVQWIPWSPGFPETLASEGYTVYVDFTATWCATCQVNKTLTVESEAVRNAMRELGVVAVKADFTRYPPDMLEVIQKFGRAGVPLNVIYPAGNPDAPIVLPEQLVGRSALVIQRLRQAGPSNGHTVQG